MMSFLETYISETFIPDKVLWSNIVKQSIDIYEENKWKCSIENRNELVRYFKIHSTLRQHRLINLTVIHPHLKLELLTLVKLRAMPIKKANCTLCDKSSNDIVKHLIMEYVISYLMMGIIYFIKLWISSQYITP